jgi:hypothetical protein
MCAGEIIRRGAIIGVAAMPDGNATTGRNGDIYNL